MHNIDSELWGSQLHQKKRPGRKMRKRISGSFGLEQDGGSHWHSRRLA